MATRLYLPTTGTPSVSPAYNASWDDTSIASRLTAVTTRISSSWGSYPFSDSDNTDKDILFRQYVFGPVAAQTISAQTVKAQLQGYENGAQNNLFFAFSIRSWNGSTFQEILALTRDDLELGTSQTNRSFSATTTARTVSDGDYIVIEIGYGGDPGPPADHGGRIAFGDAYTSDLPEDDTTTSNANPWVEFSQTLSVLGGARTIDVSDDLTVGESKTVTVSDLYVNASDGITLGEDTNTSIYIPPLLIDAKPSGMINIDFVHGDSSQFSSVSGDISVSESAALGGTTYGMECDAASGGYGEYQKNTLDKTIRARFYLHPNSVSLDAGESVSVLSIRSSSNNLAEVAITINTGNYEIRTALYMDTGGSAYNYGPIISDGEHWVEIMLVRAATDSSNDGKLHLWVDGTYYNYATGDNYDYFSDFNAVRLGRVATQGTPVGTVYLDELVVTNTTTTIGVNRDNITLGDSCSASIFTPTLTASGQDNIALGEITTVVISSSAPSVADNVLIGDTPSVVVGSAPTLTISEQDDISLGESASLAIPININAQDNITVGESTSTLTTDLYITKVDNLTIGEISNITLSVLSVIAQDNVVIGESRSVAIENCIASLSDNTIVGETSNVYVEAEADLFVSEQDDLTVGESVAVDIPTCNLSVSDNTIVGESISVIVSACYTSVSDNIGLGESQQTKVSDPNINKTDSITLGESNNVSLIEPTPIAISEQDNLVIGESQTVTNTSCYVNTQDNAVLGEDKSVENSTLYSISTDNAIVGDTPNVHLEGAGDISVQAQDNLVLGENTTVSVSDCILSVSDNVTIADSTTEEIGISIIASDNTFVGENVTVEIPSLFLTATDNIILSDVPNVALIEAGALGISVSDNVLVGESTFVSISDINIVASNDVTIGEDIDISVYEDVQDLSIAITPDSVWAIGVRIYP